MFPCSWISKVLEVFLSHLKELKQNLLQNFSNITLRSNFDDQKHLVAKVCVCGMKYDAQLIETQRTSRKYTKLSVKYQYVKKKKKKKKKRVRVIIPSYNPDL